MKIKEFKGALNPIFNTDVSVLEEDNLFSSSNKEMITLLISIEKILPRQNQPRKSFSDENLIELAQSIRNQGILQPIIVKQIEQDKYEIVAGERRWRAAQKAGLQQIPCIIKKLIESEESVIALIENLQREDLKPLETARAVSCLISQYNFTHQKIAESIGKSRPYVSNLLRVLSLEEEVKELLNENLIELGHAKVLLALKGDEQIKAAHLIVNKKLSVRSSEELVERMLNPIQSSKFVLEPEFEKKIKHYEHVLSSKLSSNVNFQFGKEGQGRIVIKFDSVDDIDYLVEQISSEKIS